ncbi:MAG: Mrp/NBP35 family ATP-binding protein [Bacteroidales bacterium]|nr:Mrp/NBP35 family ATP-binding protein [Bacteroidales bacterium]
MDSSDRVLEVLRRIIHPASGKDIIAMNLVNNLQVDSNRIRFTMEFPTFNDPLKSSLKKACTKLLQEVFGNETEIVIDVKAQLKPVNREIRKFLPEVRNIIAIASGKGGVGKSTVAVNLAVAFAAAGAKVGLIDADIFGPSIPKMLKAEFVNPSVNKVNGKDIIIPVVRYGVKTLSIGFFVNPNEATIWRGPMASSAFQQLLGDTDWGELDYMFVDLPPGTSDIHLTLVQSVPVTGAVIVSTPQDVALADAVKGIHMFRTPSVNVPVLGLVENMAWFTPEELPDSRYYIFGKDGCKKLAASYGIALLGQVPLVQGIREGGDTGEPSVLVKGPVSEAFKTIADNLVIQLLKRNTDFEPTRVVEITKTRDDISH